MSDWPILSTVTFLPLVGALLVLVIRGDDAIARRNIFYIALWTTIVTFVLSLFIWVDFDADRPRLPDGRAGRRGSAAASPTRWASTASRCCSSSSRRS